MTREECFEEIDDCVRDNAELKSLLFDGRYGTSAFLTTAEEINQYFSNVLNLTFCLIYSKFFKQKRIAKLENKNNDPVDDERKLNCYMRVNKALSELYMESTLGFAAIETTILDAQLDMHYKGVLTEQLNLSQLLKSDDENRFAYFIHEAAVARSSCRAFQGYKNLEEKYDELIEYLELFPYLKKLELSLEDISIDNYGDVYISMGGEMYPCDCLKKVNLELKGRGGETLDTCFTLIKWEKEFYFLEGVLRPGKSQDINKVLFCNFSHIGSEDNSLSISVANELKNIKRDGAICIVSDIAVMAINKDLRFNINSEERPKFLIKDFYAINYRYVKQLTLSVSDILSRENKIYFKEKYESKYPDVFNYVWDTIIAILLVRESAMRILQDLFLNDSEAYDRLLDSLQMRLGANVFKKDEIKKKSNAESKAAYDVWYNRYFGGEFAKEIQKVTRAQEKEINAEVEAICLLDYMSQILKLNEQDTGTTQKKDNNDNIQRKYAQILEWLADNSLALDRKKARICAIIDSIGGRTQKKYPLNIKSHIQMLDLLSKTDLEVERKKEKAISIVHNTLKSLYVFYCGFFEYIKIKNNFHEQSQLYILSGTEIDMCQESAQTKFGTEVKKQLARLQDEKFASIDGLLAEIYILWTECLSGGRNTKQDFLKRYLGRSRLLEFREVERLKELLNFSDTDDSAKVDGRIREILQIYDYLQNGRDKESGIDGIYPYIGTYEYMHEMRDGSNIAHFSISSPLREKDLDIEVLSEFRYTVNSMYYCMPNKMCCNNDIRLWIEPTIIDCDYMMVYEDENR